MVRDRFSRMFLVVLTLGVASQTRATVPGGGPAKSDCYAEWDGVTANAGATKVACKDGDPTCDQDGAKDGKCTFGVGVCIFQSDVTGCTPQPVTSVTIKSKPKSIVISPIVPPAPGAAAACGTQTVITIPVGTVPRGKHKGDPKPSKPLKLKMVTVTSGKPKKDIDKLVLQCLPGTDVCPANASGGPSEVTFVVPTDGVGSDLDNGFKGDSHNFPVTGSTKFNLCLSGCDASANAACTGEGATGTGTLNGPTFGAPLPLFTDNVPVCVVNRYNPDPGKITGTPNVATGDFTGLIRLLSDVYVVTGLCPTCSGRSVGDTGTCESGPNLGQACIVEGTVPVVNFTPGVTKEFKLSSKCLPPSSNKVATLTIDLNLTTGTQTHTTLCPNQLSENSCSGQCNATCTGKACNNMETDPVTGNQVCADEKGGISQLCCSNKTDQPCFPTNAEGGISRTGKAAAPQPQFPADQTYPKTSNEVMASIFCEPPTGVGTIDSITTGLPAPGALILPVAGTWTRAAQ